MHRTTIAPRSSTWLAILVAGAALTPTFVAPAARADDDGQSDTPEDAKKGATTKFEDADGAASIWKGDYLADVAPLMKPGKVGRTAPSYNLDYELGYEGDAKKIKTATVTVTVTVSLATWDNYGKRTAADAEWDRFIAALKTHEQGHVDIAKKDLADVASLAIGKTVSDAHKAIKAALDASQKGAQAAYDAENKHGETQKAVLDPSKDPHPAEKDEQTRNPPGEEPTPSEE